MSKLKNIAGNIAMKLAARKVDPAVVSTLDDSGEVGAGFERVSCETADTRRDQRVAARAF